MKVKVIKAYSARRTNELSLLVDDIIEVEEKTSIGKGNNREKERDKVLLMMKKSLGVSPSSPPPLMLCSAKCGGH